jgi:large subunit ribosomal protein L35
MKNKTHRATAKRLKVTGSGKVRRRQAGLSHLMPHKTQKQKRHMRKSAEVHPTDLKRIKPMISRLLK